MKAFPDFLFTPGASGPFICVITSYSIHYTKLYESQMLVDAGYSDVYNMEGGITAWTGAGYPSYNFV